jgi:hypothetical protein
MEEKFSVRSVPGKYNEARSEKLVAEARYSSGT